MRRENSPFNLSLLDLLTAALGAVIFLFVITPKGGAGATVRQQASIFFDTSTMQIFGSLPDSLLGKTAGDTLFALLVDYRTDTRTQEAKIRAAAAEREARQALASAEQASLEKNRTAAALAEATRKSTAAPPPGKPTSAVVNPTKPASPSNSPPSGSPTPEPSPNPTAKPESKPDEPYRGTLPSVPARVSFELKWADKADNVDLYVCQGNNCVYGNRKKDNTIGAWDSGKSRNRIFGNDLRTNQEAVRQFDGINPGTYTLYASFKESENNASTVNVETLIYTKDDKGKPRGKTFSTKLPLGEDRVRLTTVTIEADGSFTLR